MNKIRIGQAAAVLAAVAASTLTVGAASTATAAPAATDICTGLGENHRLDVGDIKNLTTKVTVGYVELCQRWDAQGRLVRWTNVRLGYTMNPGERGNGAIVFRELGSVAEYTVSTCAGGTGQIYAPDRTCATGPSTEISTTEDRAYAYIYNVNDKIIASGRTDWTR